MARSRSWGASLRWRGHLSKRKKPRLDDMVTAFRRCYERSMPFQEDRALASDLAEQVRPVFDALSDPKPDAGQDADHEALALLTLLSRRAGLLGATPSAVMALQRAIDEGLHAGDAGLDSRAAAQLPLVICEGYVAGRDERITRELRLAAVTGLALVPLAAQAFALIAAGSFEAEDLGPRLEEIERELLRTDARGLVLDVSRLVYASDDVPRLFCGVLATARSLGVQSFVCGLDAHLPQAWQQAGLNALGLERCARFEHALPKALSAVGLELKSRRRWPKPLFGRRAGDRERDPA